MVTIGNINIISGTFETFYDLIVANVPDPQSPARTKWWFSTYPDFKADNSNNYPIGIIHPPQYTWLDFTILRKWAMIEVSVEIISTSAQQADNLMDETINALESKRPDLNKIGLIMFSVASVNSGHLDRGTLSLHTRVATINLRKSVVQTHG